MTRVAILISGTGSNMVKLIEMLRDAPDLGEAVVVASNDPEAAGLDKARALGVPTVSVDHRAFGRNRAGFEAELLRQLTPYAPDLLCLAGFMRILTPDFVVHWPDKILNIHPSLLPKYPGLNTHQRALRDAAAEHGCTVHIVTDDLDDGPILGQGSVPVLPDDTPDTLAARVQSMEHRLYPAVLARVLRGETDPLLLR